MLRMVYRMVYRTFSRHFSSFLNEIAYSNEQPEDSDVINVKIYAFLRSRSTKTRTPYCFLTS